MSTLPTSAEQTKPCAHDGGNKMHGCASCEAYTVGQVPGEVFHKSQQTPNKASKQTVAPFPATRQLQCDPKKHGVNAI